ncbi:phosphate transporter PHO1 homolog 10-like [Henckelia pumila]|uniref:phosphate transporter PHO1 homolog 10-like n=1 Tax=Henckelia pumila TaxID=405737 RepID=UPI003C6DE4B0
MKFGKDLASQMVQEWQKAYIDYKHLKKQLKNVSKSRQQNSGSRGGFLERTLSLYRSFSGLTGRDNHVTKSEDEVILVNRVQPESSADDQFYQTMFLKSSEDDGERESHFFKIFDVEFNKVMRFYKENVKEVTVQAEELSKQMDTLIALRIMVYKPSMRQHGNHQEIESSDVARECKNPANRGHEGKCNMDFCLF